MLAEKLEESSAEKKTDSPQLGRAARVLVQTDNATTKSSETYFSLGQGAAPGAAVPVALPPATKIKQISKMPPRRNLASHRLCPQHPLPFLNPNLQSPFMAPPAQPAPMAAARQR